MGKKILKAIEARVSARRLVEPGPTRKQLGKLIEAGVRAPDHKLLAPWRFIAIEGKARGRFGDVLATVRGGSDDAKAYEREKAFRAPTILVVACEPKAGKVPEVEQIVATGAACQNVILAAEALGFAANWKTGDAAYAPPMKELLGLSERSSIVGILYIGTREGLDVPREARTDGVFRQL